ncbi:MAG: malto-oligosyltrehalose trehalohydrolase [Cyanobacteria bacterium P01_E01_bin.45]
MPVSPLPTSGSLNLPLQGAIPTRETVAERLRDWDFQIWVPEAQHIELELWPDGYDRPSQRLPLQRLHATDPTSVNHLPSPRCGYFTTRVPQLPAGTRYRYYIDDCSRPDPASRWQPQGVHAPSALFDPDSYSWTDALWSGISLRDCIIYELHVGTATPEGTFESAIALLPHLIELGVTVVELMPVAQFPGDRNWGYDGTFLYAVQHSYGGPAQLQKLVDACHQQGLAVFLDVVYNHLGNEGNYLWGLAHYFSHDRRTPWGPALNWDGHHCEPVREFFIANVLYWLSEFHLDGLRLDAVDCIVDTSPVHLLQDMQERVDSLAVELGRPLHLIAESATNEARYVLPPKRGGYGMAAQWTDDFHNALYAYLCGDRQAHYQDFGTVAQVVQSFQHPFVFSGQYSHFSGHKRGLPNPPALPPEQSVVFALNHDRVGNRPDGLRLNPRLSPPVQRLVAGLLLLSPYTPLLFMGEEYGETAPFYFFTDYSDPVVIDGVRNGRPQEVEHDGHFEWLDPQRSLGFERSRLNLQLKSEGSHQHLFAFHQHCIRLRQRILNHTDRYEVLQLEQGQDIRQFGLRYSSDRHEYMVAFCLPGGETTPAPIPAPSLASEWTCELDSTSPGFAASNAPSKTQTSAPSVFTEAGVKVYSA